MVVGPGGISNRAVRSRCVMRLVLDRALGEDQADLRAVGADRAGRRVVDLEDQVGAGRDLLGEPAGIDRGHVAGRVAAEVVLRALVATDSLRTACGRRRRR